MSVATGVRSQSNFQSCSGEEAPERAGRSQPHAQTRSRAISLNSITAAEHPGREDRVQGEVESLESGAGALLTTGRSLTL